MKKIILLMSLIVICTSETFAGIGSYSAVESSNYLANKGIINKYTYGSDEYRLDSSILRQEAIGISALMAGIENKSTCDGSFSDINENWVCYRAESMLEAGLIAKNTKFNPKNKVTKNEALAFSVTANCNEDYNVFRSHNDLLNQNTGDFDDLYSYVKTKNIYDLENFDGDDTATRGEMFVMSTKANIACNSDSIYSSDLPSGFTASISSTNIGELSYKNQVIHSSDFTSYMYEGKELYSINLELSSDQVKVFISNVYGGDTIIYDLDTDVFGTLSGFAASRVDIGSSGIYMLSYGQNNSSILSLLSTSGVVKTLYVGNSDQGDQTTVIQDFELLENKQVNVILEFPFLLKEGGTTSGGDGNADKEKIIESVIISID